MPTRDYQDTCGGSEVTAFNCCLSFPRPVGVEVGRKKKLLELELVKREGLV